MSVDPYWITILLGLGRLALAASMLYGLACLIFPGQAFPSSASRTETRWARTILAAALVTVIVLALAFLNVYDGLLLIIGLPTVTVAALWQRHGKSITTHLYVRLLKWADHPSPLRSLFSRSSGLLSSRPLVLGTLLGGLALGSIALRLLPLLQSPAPFSIFHYRHLELAKHLQANQLFPGHLIEARGLHGLAVALHAVTEVELDVVVRLLGVLATLLVMGGIYATVRGISRDSVAALGGAGLFGLGLPVLPFAIENQVEATPVLLASAYGLAAWYFCVRYQTHGARAHLWVSGAGLVLALVTNGAVAALALGLLVVLGLLQGGLARSGPRAHRALVVAGIGGAGALLLAGAVALRPLMPSLDPSIVPLFSVGGAGRSFHAADLPLSAYGGIVGGTALALLAAALTEQRPTQQITSSTLALSCVGLYAIWCALDAMPAVPLDPAPPTALLSIFLSVGLGHLFARMTAPLWIRLRRNGSAPVARPLHYGSVPGLLVAILLLAPPPFVPTFDHPVEPGGYVRALHKIQHVAEPYQWTLVSHYGSAVHAMNQGRFFSYDYFLTHYDAQTYDHAAQEAIPTRDLFLFVPTDSTLARIREELLISDRDMVRPMRRWCTQHRQRTTRLSVFYEDDDLTVYRLTRPPRAPRDVAALFSGSPQ